MPSPFHFTQDLSSEEMALLASFEAELTGDEIKQRTDALTHPDFVHQHELCLLAMTSSAAMLKKMRQEAPGEFDAMLEQVDAFQTQTKDLAEFVEKAFYRLLIVGSLTDDELSR